jgi:hypothetical protein
VAYSTGTATDHVDLWNKLKTFLTSDSSLVAAGQAWTVAWSHATRPNEELVLKGPGLSGTDQVYVGLWRQDGALTAGESTVNLCGSTGVIPTATRYNGHVNSSVQQPKIFLDQNPMQYWFVANGRRFVVVIKISTIYQAMYGGLYLPYARPSTYPAPYFIGGTVGGTTQSQTTGENIVSWRANTAESYRHFTYPKGFYSYSGNYYDSPALMLTPEGIWRGGTVDYLGTMDIPRFIVGPRAFPDRMGPYTVGDSLGGNFNYSSASQIGYNTIRAQMIAGLNGEMPLTPITLMSFDTTGTPNPITYGVLDGCFSVPGIGNVAENIITVAGVNHLVVPNVQRTDVSEYWALALE